MGAIRLEKLFLVCSSSYCSCASQLSSGQIGAHLKKFKRPAKTMKLVTGPHENGNWYHGSTKNGY